MYNENDFRAAAEAMGYQLTPTPEANVVHTESVPVQPANRMALQNAIDVTQPKVTSIMDLQNYAKGTIVELPGFAEGQPFIARLRRPSMLVLAKKGKIPNTLLISANELFAKGSGADVDDEQMLKNMCEVMEVVCEAAMVEPTLQNIKDAGLDLSDDQLMAIFNYTQVGVKALESFR